MVIYFPRHQYGKTYNIVLESGQVVMGMDIGLRDMCVGEKRTVVIPPHLGYGEAGVGKFKLNSRQTAKYADGLHICELSELPNNSEAIQPFYHSYPSARQHSKEGDTILAFRGKEYCGVAFLLPTHPLDSKATRTY